MARGFESKDVEFQQAEAERAATQRRRMLSPEERRARDEQQTIALTLVRARADLAAAASPAHRRMLEQAIATLEARLASAAKK